MTEFPYYDAALKADNEWQEELERVFGREAGDARFDDRGKSTPRLARLYRAKRKADEAMLADNRKYPT